MIDSGGLGISAGNLPEACCEQRAHAQMQGTAHLEPQNLGDEEHGEDCIRDQVKSNNDIVQIAACGAAVLVEDPGIDGPALQGGYEEREEYPNADHDLDVEHNALRFHVTANARDEEDN